MSFERTFNVFWQIGNNISAEYIVSFSRVEDLGSTFVGNSVVTHSKQSSSSTHRPQNVRYHNVINTQPLCELWSTPLRALLAFKGILEVAYENI